jgi:hypothetical protein
MIHASSVSGESRRTNPQEALEIIETSEGYWQNQFGLALTLRSCQPIVTCGEFLY